MKNKVVFIAYANEAMAYSLKRIGRQAKFLHVFDEVILYTPSDLPDYIKESPLMQYRYGGGYWAWKPCIIWETLQKYDEGTIVCYIDAGCTLKDGIEWTLYLELMKERDFLCFKYRDEMPCWEKFGSTSTKIKHWTKKEAILYYDELTGSEKWREQNKVLGGILFAKGKDNIIIRQWLDIVLNHPNIILDPKKEDQQFPFFAQHKHDQSLLVALTNKYTDQCWVLPELCETCGNKVAIYASRIRAKSFSDFLILKTKSFFRKLVGDRLFERIKKNFING